MDFSGAILPITLLSWITWFTGFQDDPAPTYAVLEDARAAIADMQTRCRSAAPSQRGGASSDPAVQCAIAIQSVAQGLGADLGRAGADGAFGTGSQRAVARLLGDTYLEARNAGRLGVSGCDSDAMAAAFTPGRAPLPDGYAACFAAVAQRYAAATLPGRCQTVGGRTEPTCAAQAANAVIDTINASATQGPRAGADKPAFAQWRRDYTVGPVGSLTPDLGAILAQPDLFWSSTYRLFADMARRGVGFRPLELGDFQQCPYLRQASADYWYTAFGGGTSDRLVPQCYAQAAAAIDRISLARQYLTAPPPSDPVLSTPETGSTASGTRPEDDPGGPDEGRRDDIPSSQNTPSSEDTRAFASWPRDLLLVVLGVLLGVLLGLFALLYRRNRRPPHPGPVPTTPERERPSMTNERRDAVGGRPLRKPSQRPRGSQYDEDQDDD